MSTNPLLIVVKRLITQLIILSVATAIFFFYLIFGTTENENEKKNNEEDTVALSNNAPESHQLVQYQPFKINFVGLPKSIQFSIDLRDVLKLKSVQMDPNLFMNNSNFVPHNQPEDSERKEEKKKGYSMIISLQENLLIQRMNTFGE